MRGTRATHVYDAPGVYTIAVTVTDDDTGVTTETIEVEIRGSADMAEGIADELVEPLDGADPAAQDAIQAAIDDLIGNNGGQASNGAMDKFEAGELVAALVKLIHAAEHLDSQTGVDVTAQLTLLALTAQSAAEAEAAMQAAGCEDLTAATCSKGERNKFAAVNELLAAGRSALNAGDYLEAIEAFKDAIQRS